MQALARLTRSTIAFFFLSLFVAAPAVRAQDAPQGAWQDVITGQIQAFRDGDAPAALSYAARGFKAMFPSPESFFISIISSGYAPIMNSRSHSFGTFQMMSEDSVAQLVRLVDKEQKLYEAVYMLREEDEGWRVQAVQLVQTAAVGI